MNNNILKNNEYAKFGYGIVLDGLPDIPEFHFFRPQTRFISNVIVIFLKSLNVWKDIACRDSLHESFKKMCHFLSQILFHCFVCLCICIFFLFCYPTLSLLCMFQSYNDNLFCGRTSLCFFYMTEHNYGDFCNQKQASTKNVNANLTGSLYGAT